MAKMRIKKRVKKTNGDKVQVIRLPQVQKKLGNVGKATVYRLMNEGRIPRNFKIGKRATGWLESDIDAAILAMQEEVSCG